MLRGAVEGHENQPDRAPGAGSGESGSSLPANLAARVEEIVRAAEREAAVVQRDLEAQRRVAEAEARRYLIDAKRQADALTEQRVGRLRELTDELIERAEAAQRQLEGLTLAIERAASHADREMQQPDVEPPPAPRVPDPPRVGGILPPPVRPPPSGPPPAQGLPAQPVPGTPRLPPITLPPPPGEGASTARGKLAPGVTEPAAPEPAAPEPPAEQGPEGRRRRRASRQAAPVAETGGEMHDAARLVAIEMAVAGRTRDEVDRHLRDSFRIEDTGGLLDDVFGGDSPGTSRTSWGG